MDLNPHIVLKIVDRFLIFVETVYICIRTIGAPHRMPLSPLPLPARPRRHGQPIALSSSLRRRERRTLARGRNDGRTKGRKDGRKEEDAALLGLLLVVVEIQVVLVRGIRIAASVTLHLVLDSLVSMVP